MAYPVWGHIDRFDPGRRHRPMGLRRPPREQQRGLRGCALL